MRTGNKKYGIYLRAAAAPKNAYVPGVIHGTSGLQNAKIPDLGYSLTIRVSIEIIATRDEEGTVPVYSLDDNADHTPETCANSHRWHENTCRHLTSVRDDDKPNTNDRREEERVYHRPLYRRPIYHIR